MPNAERVTYSKTAVQRRTLFTAISLVVLAVLVIAIVPRVRAWRARESLIDAAHTRLQELASVVSGQPRVDSLIQQREADLALRPQRVLRSRSRALAASALQSLVQEMAEASNVTVTRLDIANTVSSGDVPITLSANGDIFGLTELLHQIRSARFTVVIDKLQAQNNSALRGAPDVLQLALSLHAPVIVQ
ncbi:MAG: GspMb/PilO family protein [Gemmatimonas sp.]